jgi:hypothetical protein
MTDIVFWPRELLKPAKVLVTPAPFTRSAGRTLGGVMRATRTDLGYWKISLQDIRLAAGARRQTWNAIATALGGRAGVCAVPIFPLDSAPYASGARETAPLTTHSDRSTFSDGSRYRQGAITVQMSSPAAIGDTSVTLEAVNAGNLAGIYFSYQHALYRTGPATSIDGSDWTMPVFPAIRSAIPTGATLESDAPTCAVHLADDSGMPEPTDKSQIDTVSVDFVEACDYWTDLALGLVS